MRKRIETYLQKFPNDAQDWALATDEIRDMSRASRVLLEEKEGIIIKPVLFRSITTPAEWNTIGRESILSNYDRMQPETQVAFVEMFKHWLV